jgi:tetratricopeptide (TPR) repeat protein
MQKPNICSFFNSISVWSIILVPVVALLGFLPFAPLWVEGSKVLISGLLISIASIAYVLEGLFANRFSLPHKQVLLGAGLYAFTALVSTLLVKGGQLSLFGIGVEAWTISHIVAGLLFFILVSVHARNAAVRQKMTLVLVFGAFIAVAFQLVRILSLGKVGTFSVFADPVTNTLGRWYDIGIIALLLVLVSAAFFVFRAHTRLAQVLTVIVFLVSVVFFVIVSPLVGLILLAISAMFARKILAQSESSAKNSIAVQALLVLSVFAFAAFLFQGLTGRSPLFFQSQAVGTFAQTRGDIVYRDFPTTFISDSFVVAKGAVQKSPIFGVGAARFQEAWAEYRPLASNQTAWWATDFGIGSGILVTVLVMFGLLGLLGLLAFLYVVFRGLIRSLASQRVSEKIFALSAIVVWIYALVQTPSAGLMLVLFAITGIAFSFKEESDVSLTQGSNKLFALIAAVLILILPVYGTISRGIALSYARQAERAVAETPARLVDAEKILMKAVNLVPHEVYYQALASVQQRSLADIAAKVTSKELTEAQALELQKSKLAEIESTYTKSVQANPNNYVSYFRRAQFLGGTLGQTNDEVIFTSALNDVKKARSLAPTNATIDILEAQLHLAKGNADEAQKLLVSAIDKKQNYTDAALILVQLKIQQKNLKDALTVAEYAVRTNVNNSQALYIYGQLQFEAKNYLAAAQALERLMAVEGGLPLQVGRLLADSYAQVGSLEGLELARQTYEAILQKDPENVEIKAILTRIQEVTSASKVPAVPQN